MNPPYVVNALGAVASFGEWSVSNAGVRCEDADAAFG